MEVTDVTQQAAPADAGQPDQQAVEVVPVVTAPDSTGTPADSAVTVPAAQSSGSQTPDEVSLLRERYAHSSKEAIRLYQENERLRQEMQVKTAPPTQPTYSPEQLETYKVNLLQKQAQAASTGDMEKAAEYAGNIVWIDRELRKSEFSTFTQQQTANTAYQSLAQKVAPIFEKHKEDFQPGTDTANTAQALYRELVSVKKPASQFEEALFSSACALLALEQTGKFTKGVTAKAGQQALQALNTTMKMAAVSQGGAANANASAPLDASSIKNMSGPEFDAYRKRIGAV